MTRNPALSRSSSAAARRVVSRVRVRFVRASPRRCPPGPPLHRGPEQALRRPAAPGWGSFPVADNARIGTRQFPFLPSRFRNINSRSGLLYRALRIGPFLETARYAISARNAHCSVMSWLPGLYTWGTKFNIPGFSGSSNQKLTELWAESNSRILPRFRPRSANLARMCADQRLFLILNFNIELYSRISSQQISCPHRRAA